MIQRSARSRPEGIPRFKNQIQIPRESGCGRPPILLQAKDQLVIDAVELRNRDPLPVAA